MVNVQVEAGGQMMRNCRQGEGHLSILLHIPLVRLVVFELVSSQAVAVAPDQAHLAEEQKTEESNIYHHLQYKPR